MSGLILLAEFGCSERQSAARAVAVESDHTPASVSSPASALASHDIDAILDQYSAGAHDAAIRMLLDLVESGAAPVRYRPFNLTEKEFIALPQTERDALQQRMLVALQIMRKLAGELAGRSLEASTSGKPAEGTELLLAAKRLGSANRGPQVTLVVDLVGKAIENLADKRLAQLDSHTSHSPG